MKFDAPAINERITPLEFSVIPDIARQTLGNGNVPWCNYYASLVGRPRIACIMQKTARHEIINIK